MRLTEKTITRDIIYEGKIFTVIKDLVELPDESHAGREVIIHAGGAGILPVDENNDVTLVRQYRAGASEVLTEICAGKLEKGEDPQSCAIRELEEELGLKASTVTPLGYIYPTPAYDSERTYIFLAQGITPVSSHPDRDEFVEPVKMHFDKAVKAVCDGTITDAKTQIAVLRAERILSGKD